MLSELFEIYAREGFSLQSNGLNEAVLPIQSALSILDHFSSLHVLILGGDLYEKIDDGSFLNSYSDWYYEGESYLESINVARDYLLKADKALFVSFVLRCDFTP